MATTIIDAFVVALGLDASKFKKEAAELDTADKKAKAAAVKRGKELEEAQKKQRESFTALTKSVLAYAAAFIGLQSVTGFAAKIINNDAAIGRLSRTIGVSTEDISAWQGVLRGAGGTAQDAASDLSLLRNAYEDIRLTGQSSLIPYLNLLGVSLQDLDKPSDVLLKIADRFSRMDPTQAAAIGRQMGFSPAMISTLQRGREATEALLARQRELGVTTEEAARRAEDFQRQQAAAAQRVEEFGRKILELVLPPLEKFLDWLLKVSQDKQFLAFMSAAGGAMKTLGFLAKSLFDILGGGLRAIARLLSGDFSGAWQSAKDTVARAFGDIVGFLKGGWAAAVKFWNALRGVSPETNPQADPRLRGANDNRQPGSGPTGPGNAQRFGNVVQFFTDRGYRTPVARGIAAGIWAETGGNPGAFNPTGGGQGAYGIGQWRGARLRELYRRYGRNPTLFQQLEYLEWEMRGGNGEGGAGDAIRSAPNEKAALDAYVKQFMRPGAGVGGDLRRGQAALSRNASAGYTKTSNVTIGTVNVQTQATDARGIARSISSELQAAVPQANLGLA